MLRKIGLGALGMTAVLVVGVAVCQADQTKAKSKTAARVRPAAYQPEEALPPPKVASPLELGTAKPAAEFGAAAPAPAGHCAPSARGWGSRLWDWFTYRPVTHTTACTVEKSCTPPLFTYFMEYCPAPAAPHRSAACADGRCATRAEKKEPVEKESSSWLSFSFFGKSKDTRPAKPADDKAAQDDVQPAVSKVTVDLKPAKDDFRLEGKETGKWRGLPIRR